MNHAKILVIEDDDETRGLIAEELNDHGFTVVTAANGTAGLALLDTEKPALVLCDVGMPGMSGHDVLAELSERDGHDDVPFIFLTALSSREDMLRGRRMGADDYITKPIDFDLLAEVVKSRLVRVARSQHQPQPELSRREVEVLTWAGRGKSSADIAVILAITERTVNFHIENVMRKLGVNSRVQAVVQGTRLGLIRP